MAERGLRAATGLDNRVQTAAYAMQLDRAEPSDKGTQRRHHCLLRALAGTTGVSAKSFGSTPASSVPRLLKCVRSGPTWAGAHRPRMAWQVTQVLAQRSKAAAKLIATNAGGRGVEIPLGGSPRG